SSGYIGPFELEGLEFSEDNLTRSRRIARNTAHILALESQLGVVEDASYGSYHLENLTHHYAQEAWGFMQKLLAQESLQPFIENEAKQVREERLKRLRVRKHVLAGVNDFPDARERLNLPTLPKFTTFRVAQEFELLRLRVENLSTAPKVHIALYGHY